VHQKSNLELKELEYEVSELRVALDGGPTGLSRTNNRTTSSSLLKKSFFSDCSKMPRCKTPEILRSEAYLDVRRNDEG